jgi:hypothetical protein
MESFFTIALVGAVLSAFMEFVKSKFGEGVNAQVFIIVFSILFGAFFYFLEGTQYFETVLGILASATMFYEYIIKNYFK